MIHDEFSSRTEYHARRNMSYGISAMESAFTALPGRLRARRNHGMCEVVRLNACCSIGIGYSNQFKAFR